MYLMSVPTDVGVCFSSLLFYHFALSCLIVRNCCWKYDMRASTNKSRECKLTVSNEFVVMNLHCINFKCKDIRYNDKITRNARITKTHSNHCAKTLLPFVVNESAVTGKK